MKDARITVRMRYLQLPSISIVVPTRNSEKTLERCLKSIAEQHYPKKKIELIIVDAYSSDKTIEIAEHFNGRIIRNNRITGEAGKALGVDAAHGELILFVDSDNVLTSQNWILKMVQPFADDNEIVASEPIYTSYTAKEPIIIRYCSLLGSDDPLSVYLGFYGRYSYFKGRWTDIPLKIVAKKSYYEITVNSGLVPTMGANGFLIRASALRKTNYRPYLFDLDIIYDLIDLGYNKFARVKTGIFHLYAYTFTQYIKKTYRRIRDYYKYHRLGLRRYPWTKFSRVDLLKFLFNVLIIVPLFREAIKAYKRKPDVAWFLHWFACFLTMLVYTLKEISSGFYLLRKSSTIGSQL